MTRVADGHGRYLWGAAVLALLGALSLWCISGVVQPHPPSELHTQGLVASVLQKLVDCARILPLRRVEPQAGAVSPSEVVSGANPYLPERADPTFSGSKGEGLADIGARLTAGFELWTTDYGEMLYGSTQTDLPGCAKQILETYRLTQQALLVRSGYLDFSACVWSCVLVGDGWVDIAIVSEERQGSTSTFRILRLDREAWEEAYGNGF